MKDNNRSFQTGFCLILLLVSAFILCATQSACKRQEEPSIVYRDCYPLPPGAQETFTDKLHGEYLEIFESTVEIGGHDKPVKDWYDRSLLDNGIEPGIFTFEGIEPLDVTDYFADWEGARSLIGWPHDDNETKYRLYDWLESPLCKGQRVGIIIAWQDPEKVLMMVIPRH